MTYLKDLFQNLDSQEQASIEAMVKIPAASGKQLYKLCLDVASILGAKNEFKEILQAYQQSNEQCIQQLIRQFSENTVLLVHKTWVEKSEVDPKEDSKEDLIMEIKNFERDFINRNSVSAFNRFITIAEAIANLLFGQESRDPEFLHYCYRIDPKFGLFFLFIAKLRSQTEVPSLPGIVLDLQMLIGIYALSSY